MAITGMDLEAAERLASSVDLYVDQIERVRQKLIERVNDLDWWGPDAQAFRADELSKVIQYAKQMSNSAEALATACRSNLSAQREVSKG